MDLALKKLQRLICHKTQTNNQPSKFLETMFCCRNLFQGINKWVVVFVRYSVPF